MSKARTSVPPRSQQPTSMATPVAGSRDTLARQNKTALPLSRQVLDWQRPSSKVSKHLQPAPFESGQQLPKDVRAKMEHAFGADFSAVRIHEGPQARALGALAYTQGMSIHFAPGRYDPHSQRGQKLLGHELTHVVQQSQGRVSGVIQRKPTTSQAGTVAQFIEVFDNTPSGMGLTTGRAAHDAMLRLGETELSWTGPLPRTTPYFNQRPARYIYTTRGGWIDMVHFLFHAGRAYKYLIEKRDAARTLEEIQAMPWYQRMWLPPEYLQELYRRSSMSPIGESVQEGFQTERMQQVLTPRSAFSYEDIPSDTFGARFAVQHFDPNARETFGEQLAAYLNDVLGAVEPSQAPNYGELPAEDDGNVDRQNFTTTPVYTEANP